MILASVKLVEGSVAPRYTDGRVEVDLEEFVITEQGMASGLPLVDIKMRGKDGQTYLLVLTGRIVNALSAAVKATNLRIHGTEEPT